MCKFEDFKSLSLDETHRGYVELELDMWHRFYLPVGKTVLDLGAGCGETAFFYLNHGAEKVICVEGDPGAATLLRENFGSDPRVTIIPEFINSIKMDIEGAEENMIIEAHFAPILKHLHKFPKADFGTPGGVSLWRLVRMKHAFSLVRVFHQNKIAVAHRIRLFLDGIQSKKA